MNISVLSAVFKRNFVNYFANPTGYVFICLFVVLSTAAAFWPHEFFNRNLANLDQLSWAFPLIMLIFIPAITMSIWADERRQGTDELLLTIPASDFDVVLGKYLAAQAIFTLSLLFSLLCNYWVLASLGNPDGGLFLGTYFGYWMIGLAMLGIGMVASFVTSNLTVAYVLGVLFNLPLVSAMFSDWVLPSKAAFAVKQWGISEQFRDFGRGVISLSGLAYFGLILAVCLYLSMVLIGRRHWRSGQAAMPLHYAARVVTLVIAIACLTVLLQSHDVRVDVTKEKLSSLSPATLHILDNLENKRLVQIDAFVSPEVPEVYVPARLNLLSALQEIQSRAGDRVQVRVTSTEPYSDEAARADRRYGIPPRKVETMSRGTYKEDSIYLGAAITCGLEKVIVPFFDRGISPEYELVRSLVAVTQQKRKKVGVLMTDVPLMNRFGPQGGEEWPIVAELRKQYEVVSVDPSNPITEKYDVLLAVQPSALTQEQLDNFVRAVRGGQATAIFEDPFSRFASNVAGTSAPRRPPGNMMTNPMMMQNLPKADSKALWNLLGVRFSDDEGVQPGAQIVYQRYNPFPKLSRITELYPEFVFVDTGSGAKKPFNPDSPITAGLQHLLFPFPGYIVKLNSSKLDFTPLVETGEKTGTVSYSEMMNPMAMFGMGGDPVKPDRKRDPKNQSFVLAAQIQGMPAASQSMAAELAGEPASAPAAAGAQPAAVDAKPAVPVQKDAPMNVVLVADIDMLHQAFFELRAQGEIPEAGLNFDFDNITFVLNVLDELAGEKDLLDIRKRRKVHRTLEKFDKLTAEAYTDRDAGLKKIQEEYDKVAKEDEESLQKDLKDLEEKIAKEKLGVAQAYEAATRVGMVREARQKEIDAKLEQLRRKNEEDKTKINTDLNLKVNQVKNRYKLWAVMVPPILPLIVGIGVFVYRRSREKEGVSRNRLR